jgi:hypothetical protein
MSKQFGINATSQLKGGKMKFKVLSNVIEFENGSKIEMVDEIKDYKILENIIIVLLKHNGEAIFNENVFGLDTNTGKIIWQIPEIPLWHPDSPYTAINIEDKMRVFVFNRSGLEVYINYKTGSIIDKVFVK